MSVIDMPLDVSSVVSKLSRPQNKTYPWGNLIGGIIVVGSFWRNLSVFVAHDLLGFRNLSKPSIATSGSSSCSRCHFCTFSACVGAVNGQVCRSNLFAQLGKIPKHRWQKPLTAARVYRWKMPNGGRWQGRRWEFNGSFGSVRFASKAFGGLAC